MAHLKDEPILVQNSPRANHRINLEVVGRGRRHSNLSDSSERCVVRLSVGRTVSGLGRGRLFANVCSVDCLVDTGASLSIFNGSVAERLNLSAADERGMTLARVHHGAGGSFQGFFYEHRLMVLDFGPSPMPVSILFPCVLRQQTTGEASRWEWNRDFPPINVLGMRDILSQGMVCFTSGALFVFERSGVAESARARAIEELNGIVESLVPELAKSAAIEFPDRCRVGEGASLRVRIRLQRPLGELVSEAARQALPSDYRHRLFSVSLLARSLRSEPSVESLDVGLNSDDAEAVFHLTPTEPGRHAIQVNLFFRSERVACFSVTAATEQSDP
jgi:hypothetical protein